MFDPRLALCAALTVPLTLTLAVVAHAEPDPPGEPGTYDVITLGAGIAYDVNNLGWVVGTTDPFGGEAALWRDGQLTSLLPNQANEAIAYGVNDSGVVALYAVFDDEPWGRAFTWSEDGGFQELERGPSQPWAEAWDINNDGHVVGFVEDMYGYPHASLWVDGSWSDIGGVMQPESSWAFGINDLGESVGFVTAGPAQACFFDNGAVTFGAADHSSAYGVNDWGQVVGRTRNSPGNYDLWSYRDGTFSTIANGANVDVTDVNDRGQVVGSVEQSAFLWQQGSFYSLEALVAGSPGLSEANGINDCGMIVGATTGSQAFLLVPVDVDSVDTDSDGLYDTWEMCGIDSNFDGTVDLVLPGADPEHKDIYVELDAMVGHVPSFNALDLVVGAFADAPLENPDGTTGIALHFVGGSDPDVPGSACDPCVDEDDAPSAAWADESAAFLAFKSSRFGSAAERAHGNANAILDAKALVFRYGVSAESFVAPDGSATYSGFGEIPGNDFFVTVGAALKGRPVTDPPMAGTLMHELGHTLGLEHGGDQGEDRHQFKPNYFSVMNYLWQIPIPEHTFGAGSLPDKALEALRMSWNLRYADGAMSDLDETSLSEAAGMGGESFRSTVVGSIVQGSGDLRLVPMGGPIDWNFDGDTVDVNVDEDLNYLPGVHAIADQSVLTSPDDWALVQILPTADVNWQDKGTGQDEREEWLAWAKDTVAFDPTLRELNGETIDAMASLRFDCDGDGIYDDVEITQGLVPDANDNGIPDPCESATPVAVGPPRDSHFGLEVGAAAPNPTGSATAVVFRLEHTARVEISVFDLAGRRVRVLVDERTSPGVHVTRWDGRDDAGRSAASGVYFLRVLADGESVSKKVVLRR